MTASEVQAARDGGRPSPAEQALVALLGTIGPLDADAMAAAGARLDRLTKPPGSLGRLESLVIELAGITGRVDAPVARRSIVVAVADHGVTRRGVSAYPADVTAGMVANFVAGGAAINVLAAEVGATVTVVDAGVAGPIPPADPDPARGGRLVSARIRDGHGRHDGGAGDVAGRGAPRDRGRPGRRGRAARRRARPRRARRDGHRQHDGGERHHGGPDRTTASSS